MNSFVTECRVAGTFDSSSKKKKIISFDLIFNKFSSKFFIKNAFKVNGAQYHQYHKALIYEYDIWFSGYAGRSRVEWGGGEGGLACRRGRALALKVEQNNK